MRGPGQLRVRATRFLRSQRYQARSRIFLIQVASFRPVTNERAVVEKELEHEPGRATDDESARGAGVVSAPPGLHTVSTPETVLLRTVSVPAVTLPRRPPPWR